MDPQVQLFHTLHNAYYSIALSEMRSGRKRSDWMPYIFPQMCKTEEDRTAMRGILSLAAARAILQDPVLRDHLVEITTAVLELPDYHIGRIFSQPDADQFHSFLTLFMAADPDEKIFRLALDKFFDGHPDSGTVDAMKQQENKRFA